MAATDCGHNRIPDDWGFELASIKYVFHGQLIATITRIHGCVISETFVVSLVEVANDIEKGACARSTSGGGVTGRGVIDCSCRTPFSAMIAEVLDDIIMVKNCRIIHRIGRTSFFSIFVQILDHR